MFFLQKIKEYILPFSDIIAWCLMPNHFHLMIYVNKAKLDFINQNINRTRTLNQSIAIMLRSYTRAINLQENRTGSLFRERTKALCLTKNTELNPSYFNSEFGTVLTIDMPELNYVQVCFEHIHQNPIKAGLVNAPEDWEFSSYLDFTGIRNGQLINRKRIEELIIC
ncbi:transposase [Saccharicrinis sp. FJH54]|uniref:transposase n=1 Tax=Saccharicrinis sp. FJH54 TaxID=3344665 RepID=UPI0035D49AAC